MKSGVPGDSFIVSIVSAIFIFFAEYRYLFGFLDDISHMCVFSGFFLVKRWNSTNIRIQYKYMQTHKIINLYARRYSVKEMSRAGPKKGAQNQPCQPRSFQGMSEKEEKFKQNQVQ